MKQISQQVAFERSVEEQAVKRGVVPKGANDLLRDMPEQPAIVPALGQFLHFDEPAVTSHGGFFFVQDRVVKIFLACEMAEEDSLADAGGCRNVFGLRSTKSVASETINRYTKQLAAAIFARHPNGAGGSLGLRGLG